MRLTSDILTCPVIGRSAVPVRVPLAMAGKYVGLVFVLAPKGELLAIFPGGFIQAIRSGYQVSVILKKPAQRG